MADLATGEIVADVIDGAVAESQAKVPKAVPVKGDENDRQEAAFRWAPEDIQHSQAEKIDRLEREAAAAMRDNERLRKQVEVEQTDLAPVGADQEATVPGDVRVRDKLVRAKQLVWKTVPVYDEKGHLQRSENPLAQYGIEVTQVLIGDP